MIKRCTNGKCRRKFQVPEKKIVTCPYCGKVYPRMVRGFKTYSVVLTDYKKFPDIERLLKDLCGFDTTRIKYEAECVKKSYIVILKRNLMYHEAVEFKRNLYNMFHRRGTLRIESMKEPIEVKGLYRDLSSDVCWRETICEKE